MLTPTLLVLFIFLVILVLVLILHVSNRTQAGNNSQDSDSEEDVSCCAACCSLCCVFCWIFCCPPCPACIAKKVAFQPPSEATYTIEDISNSAKLPSQRPAGCLRLHASAQWPLTKHDLSQIEAFYADTTNGRRIACLYIAAKSEETSGSCSNYLPQFTLLFSHGNACDLGQVAGLYLILSRVLSVNIFSYDYQGYGVSSGSPSERNLYVDIDAAYKTLLERFGVPPKRIILYGQSIGSAPTIDLASRTHGLGGVVIQSGFSSGLRYFCPSLVQCCYCCDNFVNVDKVGNITAPVLVVHGTADEVIPIKHGIELFQKAPHTVEPCWLQDAGHNDVFVFNEFIFRMKKFIGELEQIEAGLMEV